MGEISTVGKVFISIGLIAVCSIIFILTYLLNKKTKKPEGCQDDDMACAGCKILSCSNRVDPKKEGEKND